jgi:hypothetical protein
MAQRNALLVSCGIQIVFNLLSPEAQASLQAQDPAQAQMRGAAFWKVTARSLGTG